MVYVAILTLHALELLLPLTLPSLQARIWHRFPDIYPVLNVLLCTPCFALIYLWALKRQWEVGFASALEFFGLFGRPGKRSASTR